MAIGLSGTGTSEFMLQLGDAGGIEATGYVGVNTNSAGSNDGGTTGWPVDSATVAASVYDFIFTIYLEDSANFTWICKFIHGTASTARGTFGSGHKSLSAELTTVRLTTIGGSDTFDANSGVNVQYE